MGFWLRLSHDSRRKKQTYTCARLSPSHHAGQGKHKSEKTVQRRWFAGPTVTCRSPTVTKAAAAPWCWLVERQNTQANRCCSEPRRYKLGSSPSFPFLLLPQACWWSCPTPANPAYRLALLVVFVQLRGSKKNLSKLPPHSQTRLNAMERKHGHFSKSKARGKAGVL